MDAMKRWQDLIDQVHKRVYEISDSPVGYIIGIKYVLFLKGICSPQMAMPVYEELSDGQKKTMAELVEEFESYGL
jgi:hypothetical protein